MPSYKSVRFQHHCRRRRPADDSSDDEFNDVGVGEEQVFAEVHPSPSQRRAANRRRASAPARAPTPASPSIWQRFLAFLAYLWNEPEPRTRGRIRRADQARLTNPTCTRKRYRTMYVNCRRSTLRFPAGPVKNASTQTDRR